MSTSVIDGRFIGRFWSGDVGALIGSDLIRAEDNGCTDSPSVLMITLEVTWFKVFTMGRAGASLHRNAKAFSHLVLLKMPEIKGMMGLPRISTEERQ